MFTFTLQNLLKDYLFSLQFLTRFPVSKRIDKLAYEKKPFLKCVWAFPLAGISIAIILIMLTKALIFLGFNINLISIFIVIAALFITGALHEDGLADCADGFGGGRNREKKLAIMKDSNVGTYGVLALLCLLILRISLYETFLSQSFLILALSLIASFAFSRSLMVFFWYHMPMAKQDGLASTLGKPSSKSTLIALSIGFLCPIFILPFAFNALQVFIAFFAAIFTFLIFKRICKTQIGGQTGDTSGAFQTITECIFLFFLTIG